MRTFSTYKDRLELLDIISKEKPKITCEVGVARGEFSFEILSRMPSIEKHYLVDLYAHQENYKDGHNFSDESQMQQLNSCKTRLEKFSRKTDFQIGRSTEMSRNIQDQELDFVYIDARHDYWGCMQDLICYWPKVKDGGIMSGHDYHTAEDIPHNSDWSLCADGTVHNGAVKECVNDFSKLLGKQVLVSYKEKAFHTWTILK